MKLIINKDRTVYPVGTWGTKNENDYEILEFEFSEELDEYNKRIVYYLDEERVWDAIVDNKAYLTNAITQYEKVKAYVWLTKENTEREADTDFRTKLFEMKFFENENADGIVPTEEQVDGFNTILTAMNRKIDEVNALETTIEQEEADRQENENARISNEQTRQSNESTRESNEQTRQLQETDRERRTSEAIADIEDKTAEYNANAEAKTNEFNQNATQKTNEFNSNYTQKVNDFDSNASSKESAFNSNASSKTSVFNSNAETKTNAFNTNVTNKTNAFNSNATEKTTAFDNNANAKTTEFNSNVESKITEFNTNATNKTNDFNENAAEKATAFNENAQNKIDEYDEHIVDYQAQIDELQEEVTELSENMPWAETEQATEINITDAAKYSRNKLELFGNTEQASYTGKNLLNLTNGTYTSNSVTAVVYNGKITINGTATSNSTITIPIEKQIDTDTIVSISINNTETVTASTNPDFRIGNYSSSSVYFNEVNSKRENYTTLGDIQSVQIRTISGVAYNSFIIYPQVELGSTATDYEPYTGGQPSPNPDYPQDIHVVTGNNTIEVQGKNLLDLNNTTNGYIDINGQVVATTYITNRLTDYIEFSNSITISLDTTIYGIGYALFDENKNYLSRVGRIANINKHTISDNSAKYIRIWFNYDNSNPTTTELLLQLKAMVEPGSTATSYEPYYHADYPINLGDIELCKIGDYQDYLYKENGNWYKYGAIDKYVYNNDLTSNGLSEEQVSMLTPALNVTGGLSGNQLRDMSYCNMMKTITVNHTGLNGTLSSKKIRVNVSTDYATSYNGARQLYADNNLTIYFVAEEPVITQITDTTLISQLDAIYEHFKLTKGINNITVTASDLKPYMKLSYMQDLPTKLNNLDSRLALLE